MKVLVTGASGFLGSWFCRHAVDLGWEIHALLRETSPEQQLEAVGALGKISIHRFDGSQESLNAVVESARPDAVCHCASLFVSEHSPEDVGPLVDANVRFGAQLLEAMAGSRVTSLVNVGTSWQFFESEQYRPVNLYAATKEAFLALVDYYRDACGMRCVDLKLYDVFGPEDPRKKLLPLLKDLAGSGKTLDMSPGEQEIELNFVDDVVRALEVACVRVSTLEAGSRETFGVTGERMTLKKLVATVESVLGKSLHINWGGRPYRQREVMKPWRPSAGQRLPNWKSEVSLEEGLVRMFSLDKS